MKITSQRSWPHPVLSPLVDDIQDNAFEFDLTVRADSGSWELSAEAKDPDPHIDGMVRAGRAVYLMHVECPRTFYRAAIRSSLPSCKMAIPGQLIYGVVEVSFFVVAADHINKYRHPQQHADYGDTAFSISAGLPLAVAQAKTFEAFLDADPLAKLSSLIDIKRDKDLQRMAVDCEGDRITIKLPPAEFDRYKELRSDATLHGLLANSVILPALMDGIFYLRSLGAELEDFKAKHRWSRCLLARLDALQISAADPGTESSRCLEAAQILLQGPLKRSLDKLSELFQK